MSWFAKKVELAGHKFDSIAESLRYRELFALSGVGEVTELQVHVPYDLVVNGMKIGRYTADFVYQQGGVVVVEDLKGARTAAYQLRKKLMKACHGITITEVDASLYREKKPRAPRGRRSR